MKTMLAVALLCLQPMHLAAQLPAAPPLQSGLLGVALPAGTTISGSGLYRMSARASLSLDASKAGLTLGTALELLRLPMTAPARPELIAMIRGGGWSLTMTQADTSMGVAEKEGAAFVVQFTDTRRERWIYVAAVSGGSATQSVAQGTSAPSTGAPPSSDAAPTPPPPAVAPAPEPPAASAAPMTDTRAASVGRAYAFTTSTFDDGWSAREQPQYVEVTKGPITALLFYRVPITEQMRPPASNVNDYFWARDVAPRFEVQSVDRRRQELAYAQTEYLEGEATERATGKPVYIGMNVNRESGGALAIVVIAPDKATFRQLYPKPDDLERMLTYNKFAVAPSDLAGHWDETSSALAQMYYTTTGNYAGMNLSTANSQFFFNPDGSYTSKHAGAYGMVGNSKVYADTYSGRVTMRGNWEVAMTNRFEGRTETFAVQFEIVQGGRILHLMNVKATGIRYHLGRVP